MILSVYEPLTYSAPGSTTLTVRNVANFVEFEKYEYHKYWRDIGSFSLTLPASADEIWAVHPDMILFVNEGGNGLTNDSLIINEISNDGMRVTLSGTDLKGLLSYRQTLFPQAEIEAGTYGHDVRQGTTGEIIAGYIDYNCINASDPNRNIPGLRIGSTYGGLQNDTYMSRLQPLNEVVTALCKNADIGWDIVFAPNTVESGYTFNIVTGSDRTNANGRYKCVFADYLHNAEAITKQEKSSERRNVIWTVNGTDTDKAVVTSIYKQDPNLAKGFNRRETVLTANCDLDLTESYVDSRTADMVDKLQVSLKLVDSTMYGSAFLVGDKVTVMKGGTAYDRRIIQADKSYSAEKRDVTIQLGDIPTKKYFEKTTGDLSSRADDVKELALENAATKKTVVDNKAPHIYFSGTIPNFPYFDVTQPEENDICICWNTGPESTSFEVWQYQMKTGAKNNEVRDNPMASGGDDDEEEEETENSSQSSASTPTSTENRVVSAISVQKEPNKTGYHVGEALDLTGGVLLVRFSDGNITTVSMTDPDVTTSGYNPNPEQVGKEEVRLLYGGQSTTLNVYVGAFAWVPLGRTLTFDDVKEEYARRLRITNGIEE